MQIDTVGYSGARPSRVLMFSLPAGTRSTRGDHPFRANWCTLAVSVTFPASPTYRCWRAEEIRAFAREAYKILYNPEQWPIKSRLRSGEALKITCAHSRQLQGERLDT